MLQAISCLGNLLYHHNASIMLKGSAPTARSKLTTLCTRLANEGPKFVTADDKNDAGNFVCLCTTPVLHTEDGDLESQTFQGEALSKKKAVAGACEKAWAWLSSTTAGDVLKPQGLPDAQADLAGTIKEVISNKVCALPAYSAAP